MMWQNGGWPIIATKESRTALSVAGPDMSQQKLPQQVNAKCLTIMFLVLKKKICGGKCVLFWGGVVEAGWWGQVWAATGGKAAAARLTGLLTNWQGPAR